MTISSSAPKRLGLFGPRVRSFVDTSSHCIRSHFAPLCAAAAGVKFERAQTKQWIVATLLSFVSDALVTEPAMELLKVVAALLVMLWQHSVKGAIMHALAAKRDAARLRLKLARAQQIIEARERLGGGRDGASASPTAAGGSFEGGLASSMGSPGAAAAGAEHAALPELRRYGVADLLSGWPGRR
jgi:hypothetical protein